MNPSSAEPPAPRALVLEAMRGPDFLRATFGGPKRGDRPCLWLRAVVRPVEIRGERHLQFSYYDAKKHIAKNYRSHEADAPLRELLAFGFAAIHLATRREEIDIRTSKKGHVQVGRRPARPTRADPSTAHNRIKDVPLPEGRADRLLDALGVLTRDHQVRPTMRAKFTQINEFLTHLEHGLADAGLRALGRPVSILDCGCGLSYLTLAAHHYLNDVLGVPAKILGVDVNDEVIRKSGERAERLGAGGLAFSCGRIGAIEEKADVVLALHACDTATDDALAQAVRSEARLLLCAPCCHHDLNRQLHANGPAEALRPLLRHGILRERTADLVTDAFRALALRIVGYRTDVIEFVGVEHTARNLMIRAVRSAPPGDPAATAEYREMRRFWGVIPYIEVALGDSLERWIVESAG